MSRMLDALKTLEARRPSAAEPTPSIFPIAPDSAWRSSLVVDTEATAELDPADWDSEELSIAPPTISAPRLAEPAVSEPVAPPSEPASSLRPCVACCLPTTLDVSDHYLEMAERIGEQVRLELLQRAAVCQPGPRLGESLLLDLHGPGLCLAVARRGAVGRWRFARPAIVEIGWTVGAGIGRGHVGRRPLARRHQSDEYFLYRLCRLRQSASCRRWSGRNSAGMLCGLNIVPC